MNNTLQHPNLDAEIHVPIASELALEQAESIVAHVDIVKAQIKELLSNQEQTPELEALRAVMLQLEMAQDQVNGFIQDGKTPSEASLKQLESTLQKYYQNADAVNQMTDVTLKNAESNWNTTNDAPEHKLAA